MFTNEVVKETGIGKQTLMFYEKEGLITPKRLDNKYRDYSEEDLQCLHLIKFLRSMDIALDDIKLVLEGKVLLSECLEHKAIDVEMQLENINQMKNTIQFLKLKQLPLIPALANLDLKQEPVFLPYLKANNHVSIGRRMDKKVLKRTICYLLITTIILLFCSAVGFKKVMHHYAPFWFYLGIMFLIGLIYIVDLRFSNPQFTYIEFVENGVYYIPFETMSLMDKLRHYIIILNNGQSEFDRFQPYEQIKSLTLTYHKSYIKTGYEMFPYPYIVVTFSFVFYNGERLKLLSTDMSRQDKVLMSYIVKDKVINICDPHHILEAYIQDLDLVKFLWDK